MNQDCIICPVPETVDHIFFKCRIARHIWNFLHPTLAEIMRPKIVNTPKLLLGIFPDNIPIQKRKMILTLIQIALHYIWVSRNKILKGQGDQQIMIKTAHKVIPYTFSKIITNKFNENMPNNLAAFREEFCHTTKVCTIIANTELSVRIINQ